MRLQALAAKSLFSAPPKASAFIFRPDGYNCFQFG
jgi:hypothetical protein